MPEVRAKIPDDLYSEFTKFLQENNKTVKEGVIEAIRTYLKGKQLVIESLPKFKVIITQYDTKCMFCGKDIPRGSKVLWFKGYGVVCKECALKSLAEKYLDKDIAKQYVKTLADLERIKAIKSEAKRQLKELLMKIAVIQEEAKIYEIRRLVKDLAIQVNEYYNFLIMNKMPKEEFLNKMNEVLNKLNQVLEELEKHEFQVPQKWLKELKIELR